MAWVLFFCGAFCGTSSTPLGYPCDISQTSILKNTKKLEPSQEILPTPTKQHQKTQRLTTLTEVEKLFPGFAAFIDATKQEIPRPKNKRKRKTHYSGKKKKPTVKTQLTVNKQGLIVHKTRVCVFYENCLRFSSSSMKACFHKLLAFC